MTATPRKTTTGETTTRIRLRIPTIDRVRTMLIDNHAWPIEVELRVVRLSEVVEKVRVHEVEVGRGAGVVEWQEEVHRFRPMRHRSIRRIASATRR